MHCVNLLNKTEPASQVTKNKLAYFSNFTYISSWSPGIFKQGTCSVVKCHRKLRAVID